MDVIDAAVQRDIVLLLAVIVVVLGGVVATVAVTLYRQMGDRVKRGEDRADRNASNIEKLVGYIETILKDRGQL